MTPEAAVRARLVASPDVTALIGPRIYAVRLPQPAALPAVTYQRVSTAPDQTYEGPSGLVRARVQVDAWAATYNDARALAAAIRSALETFTDATIQAAFLASDRDLHEDDIRTFRVSSDWVLYFNEEE